MPLCALYSFPPSLSASSIVSPRKEGSLQKTVSFSTANKTYTAPSLSQHLLRQQESDSEIVEEEPEPPVLNDPASPIRRVSRPGHLPHISSIGSLGSLASLPRTPSLASVASFPRSPTMRSRSDESALAEESPIRLSKRLQKLVQGVREHWDGEEPEHVRKRSEERPLRLSTVKDYSEGESKQTDWDLLSKGILESEPPTDTTLKLSGILEEGYRDNLDANTEPNPEIVMIHTKVTKPKQKDDSFSSLPSSSFSSTATTTSPSSCALSVSTTVLRPSSPAFKPKQEEQKTTNVRVPKSTKPKPEPANAGSKDLSTKEKRKGNTKTVKATKTVNRKNQANAKENPEDDSKRSLEAKVQQSDESTGTQKRGNSSKTNSEDEPVPPEAGKAEEASIRKASGQKPEDKARRGSKSFSQEKTRTPDRTPNTTPISTPNRTPNRTPNTTPKLTPQTTPEKAYRKSEGGTPRRTSDGKRDGEKGRRKAQTKDGGGPDGLPPLSDKVKISSFLAPGTPNTGPVTRRDSPTLTAITTTGTATLGANSTSGSSTASSSTTCASSSTYARRGSASSVAAAVAAAAAAAAAAEVSPKALPSLSQFLPPSSSLSCSSSASRSTTAAGGTTRKVKKAGN